MILFWLFHHFGLLVCVTGSFYNPHPFPDSGPFFEGWYLRITNNDTDDSIGLLFGEVLPASSLNTTGPLVLASILYRACTDGGACTLLSSRANFTLNLLNISVDGQPVTHNPDRKSEANFKWAVNNGEDGGIFIQARDQTNFDFRLGEWTLRGAAGTHVPWNNDESGPEGWLGYFPLPLHWFVYSLRSPLTFFELQNVKTGTTVRGTNGIVHLEKNWGKSFPKQWIWSEGVARDGSNVTFAVSGGLVNFSLFSVDAYLVGYTNPSVGFALDYRPDNSVVTAETDGCKGLLNLTVRSFTHELEIEVFGSPKTFSSCLYGPETSGFRRACVESYDAMATITVRQGKLFGSSRKVIDKQTLMSVALEFGGNNVCGQKCGKF